MLILQKGKNVSRKKLTLEQVKDRLYEVHGDIVKLDETTYINTSVKARFIDKDYGEWWALPCNLIYNKYGNRKRSVQQRIKKQKVDIDTIKERLFLNHGNVVVLDEKTWIDTHTKCKFIDKDYGEWWALPINIVYHGKGHPNRISKKKKKTWLKNYGVDHPSKNKKILKKILKSQTNSCILKHWKTGNDLVCTASYEKKVVEYLNKNKIDFDWQIKFEMPNNRNYFCDLYLKEQDKYVEIKGYFWKDAKEKWDWFHKNYPNSELWNEKKLKKIKIL